MVMIIQLVLGLFIIFAVSRVILQVKNGNLSPLSFLFWASVFILALVGLFFPQLLTRLARFFGIGRGVDVVIYISLILLFYLVFRLHALLEDLRHDLAKILREIALKDIPKSEQ